MAVDLYYIPLSPPCRTVMMAAYMAGVDVNLKLVNLMAGEQMKPEFLKVNPLHTGEKEQFCRRDFTKFLNTKF